MFEQLEQLVALYSQVTQYAREYYIIHLLLVYYIVQFIVKHTIMPPARQLYDNDMFHYQLLQRVSADTAFVHSLQPSDIDKLGVEVSKAFQRASVPESTVPIEEREVNEYMLGCIGTIDHELSLKQDSAQDGAKLILFRRTMITPENLEALFRMCDPNIRTGRVRCHAFWQLRTLVTVQATWKVKLQPDSNNSTSVAARLITVMFTALSDQRSYCEHNAGKVCRMAPWTVCAEALAVCRDKPEQVVDLIHPYDWTTILQRSDAAVIPRDASDGALYYDFTLFITLHRWPVRLLQEDHNNSKAKEVLRKLGSCDTLMRRVLRRLVSGEISSKTATTMSLEEIFPVANFLIGFLHCLSPVPWDRDIESLVHRAHAAISQSFMTTMTSEMALFAQNPERSIAGVNTINEVSFLLDHWKELHEESEEARWQRFRRRFLSQEAKPDDNKALSKTVLKASKKQVKSTTNLTEGEMCANCYVLEKTLHDKLLKCGQCRLIKYCSRECQREHWKAHKKQCKKVALS
jgi:hypothetical protein